MALSEAKLLVVDDEQDILELLVLDLEDRAKQVHSAIDPASALDILKTNKVDLIITDLSMPGMNGLELAAQVESLYPNVQVVVLSGYSKVELKDQVKSKNVAAFVEKPVFGDTLIVTIEQCLHKAA